MTEENLRKELEHLSKSYPFKMKGGVDDAKLNDVVRLVGYLPDDLRCLYRVTNGLTYEWFRILPIERQDDLKNTWDDIHRANNINTSKFFDRSEELLNQFLVFSEISGGYCACYNRKDNSIWFEDMDGLHQTDLNLVGFIETVFREVAEL